MEYLSKVSFQVSGNFHTILKWAESNGSLGGKKNVLKHLKKQKTVGGNVKWIVVNGPKCAKIAECFVGGQMESCTVIKWATAGGPEIVLLYPWARFLHIFHSKNFMLFQTDISRHLGGFFCQSMLNISAHFITNADTQKWRDMTSDGWLFFIS